MAVLAPPLRLAELQRRFSLEEVASILRHDARNHLSAVRNAAFYLGRKVRAAAPALVASDPRVPEFFELIDSELRSAEEKLASRFPPLPAPTRGTIDGAALIAELAADLALPGGVRLETEGSAPLAGDPAELALAVYCLIENAVDSLAASGGRIVVRCMAVDGATSAIEVEDDGAGFDEATAAHALDPLFTTRPGRLGLGLKIARRILGRGQGRLELAPGARVRLIIPLEEGDR